MKVNLAGLLHQAAEAIDPEKDRGAYAYMMREIADHIQDVHDRRSLAVGGTDQGDRD